MDPKPISSLAKLLRDSGDKVLNANFKLTLSGSLLRSLNDSFPLIADQNEIYAPQTFQVVKANNSKADIFRDLQFIHDFVQKIKVLCITHFPCDDAAHQFDTLLDISKFRSLRRLEIRRVHIVQIMGIQQMRAHLEEIMCQRSIDHVKDIISHCGGDKSTGFVWNELKIADFSYNNLTAIDCSLEFAPWLQHLNLSNNKIVSVDAIKWLPNLKYLNLSFNRLSHMPLFHTDASRRLKTLIVSHNCIEDVTEVSRLDSLNELDLAGNCILDHATLMPISTLISLHYLNLQGNPLACCVQHRQATARHLHRNTSSVKFILDNEPLSKSEKALTGMYHSYNLILTTRIGRSTGNVSTPIRRTQDNTPASSFNSRKSDSARSFTSNMNASHLDDNLIASSSTVSMASQKKVRRIRQAVIVDIEPEPSAHRKQVCAAVVAPLFEAKKDHLDTKRIIENLRRDYGDDWLQNHGEHIQPTDETKRASRQDVETLLASFTQTPTLEKQINFEATNDSSVQTENVTTTNVDGDQSTERHEENVNDYDIADVYASSGSTDLISDTEDNETTYIVVEEPNDIKLLLVVSDASIREKDVFTAKTKTKWSIKTLESCDQIKADVLRLNFDTIKKDRKERIYKVETGLGQKLEQYLRNILSKRPLTEMNQTLYRCANCNTQFSRENIYKKQNIDVCCPECKSTYVIEIKESPREQSVERVGKTAQPKAFDALRDVSKVLAMQPCESQSSIGSATSLNESSSCSKISKSDSFDSNQSVAGSSNCDRDGDFQSKATAGDSDIEILSNPSQSSIEVLDSFHSGHRKYSEERRVSQVPSLDPIEDNSYNSGHTLVNQQTSTQDLNAAMDSGYDTTVYTDNDSKTPADGDNKKKMVLSGLQLTESSSSGSVTDSICTAYEQNRQMTATTIERTTTPESGKATKQSTPEKSLARPDGSGISSVLGGIFLSTINLMSPTQKPPLSEPPCDEFKFSYTEFDNVDHRLKLYLYQNIFEDNKEHLKWLVKGKMFNDSQSVERTTTLPQIFSGIFVMSTTKFYVLQIVADEREDVSKWLKRIVSGTIDRLETIRVLPWKIGISFSIKSSGNIFFFLQDISRTDNLLLFFANNPLSDFCTLVYQISERLSQKLLKITDNTQLRMLAILNSCETSCDDDVTTKQSLDNVAFIVTESNVYITAPVNQWISEKIDSADIHIEHTQQMTNLVEIDKIDCKSMRINFVDDTQDKVEMWTCVFETSANAASTSNAISQSWEKRFGVPLDIHMNDD